MNSMKRIATLIGIFFISLTVFGQASSKSNSSKGGSLNETAKSKSNSKIYERGGKNFEIAAASRVNTPQNEYYLATYKDGIVYSIIKSVGNPGSQADVSFYFSKVANGQPANPVKFEHNYIGNLIPIAANFDGSGQQMFLTCLELASDPANKSRTERYHILGSTMKDGKWANFNELSFSKNLETAGFPVINSASNTIYFSGKQKGNNTGFDIFTVTKSTDWGTAKKLGEVVNTSKDEIMPSLYNNTLFFASNGRGGLGQFALFLIDMSKKEAESYILDSPLSTNSNDIFIYVSKDNKSGFLINDSKKKATGDIYSFKLNGPETFIK